MTKQKSSPETKVDIAEPVVDLLSKYESAVIVLDEAHEHRDRVTPPWPHVAADDLTDEFIAQMEADHREIPAVAKAQAKMDAAARKRNAILKKMIATAAKTFGGVAAKLRAAATAPDEYAEALRESVIRDSEALAA